MKKPLEQFGVTIRQAIIAEEIKERETWQTIHAVIMMYYGHQFNVGHIAKALNYLPIHRKIKAKEKFEAIRQEWLEKCVPETSPDEQEDNGDNHDSGDEDLKDDLMDLGYIDPFTVKQTHERVDYSKYDLSPQEMRRLASKKLKNDQERRQREHCAETQQRAKVKSDREH